MRKLHSNRAGKIGIHVDKIKNYEFFIPESLFNVTIVLDEEITFLVGEACKYLGILEGISKNLAFSDTIVAKYVEKESLLSAQIEGTQASLHDVFEANKDPAKARKGVEDVVNYIKAVNYGIELLNELPICTRFFNKIHKVLLKDIRGQHKSPGSVREKQNWIGPRNALLNEAWFVPPDIEDMNKCLSDLEKYINTSVKIHPLIKLSLIHYQFETIHPYLDGNGRLGRLLISLFLKQDKFLSNPILYLSLYLKQHRSEYYELLTNVRIYGDYERWVKFFLKGIIDTSKQVINTITEIQKIKNDWQERILKLNKNNENLLLKMLNFIFSVPYFNANDLIINLKTSKQTANKLIKQFIDLNIIEQENKNKQRFNTYKVSKYLKILEKGTEI